MGPDRDVAAGRPLTVRASLTNRAEHAQPYPLLRLEFEDRFGAAVAGAISRRPSTSRARRRRCGR